MGDVQLKWVATRFMTTVLLLFSSPQSFSTGFRSEDWNGHSRSLFLCSLTHFCVVFEVCVWIIVRLEDPNMAHYKISNSQSLIDFCICWYLIESIMPICPGPPAEMYAHNIKNTAVYFIVHMGYFLSLTMCSPNPSWVFAAKKLICLVTSDHRSQSHLKFQSCLITECAGDCFLVKAFSFLDFFLNMWCCRCCLITSLKVFWPQNSTFFCNYLATQTLH